MTRNHRRTRTDILTVTLSLATSIGALAQSPAQAPGATPTGETTAPAPMLTWYHDLDAAQAAATRSGKDLLIGFTGSDWCSWCIRLEKEVLSQDGFREAMQRDFILVSLDFPRGEAARARVPNPTRNQELQLEHRVEGFPTVLLMDSTGEVFGRTGYQPGGPQAYISHLETLSNQGRTELAAARALSARFAEALDDERTEVIREAVSRLKKLGSDAAGTAILASTVGEAFSLEDIKLQKAALEALAHARQTDARAVAAAQRLDPTNQDALLEMAIASINATVARPEDLPPAIARIHLLDGLKLHDTPLAIELFGNAAIWCENFMDDHEKAVEFAKKTMALDPPDHVKMMLMMILNA